MFEMCLSKFRFEDNVLPHSIYSKEDLLDPEKSAIATAIILGVRYNEQLTPEQKKLVKKKQVLIMSILRDHFNNPPIQYFVINKWPCDTQGLRNKFLS